jgi:hypothetical protein
MSGSVLGRATCNRGNAQEEKDLFFIKIYDRLIDLKNSRLSMGILDLVLESSLSFSVGSVAYNNIMQSTVALQRQHATGGERWSWACPILNT